jgi:hypothetical protein
MASASILLAAVGLLAETGAQAADKDQQLCAGFAPPYKNDCSFPIIVYSKTEKGSLVRAYQLAPGQVSPDERTPAERGGGVMTVVCRAGEKAFRWDGGAHGTTPWAGEDGYECRKE